MGFWERIEDEVGLTREEAESMLIELLKERVKKNKIAKVDLNPTNQFIQFYCDEFKKLYGTHPTIDGKTAGLAKGLVKDLGLAKCQLLMLTYLKMRRRDFVLKHHDLVTFKFNLNAITVEANVGRSVDTFDAQNIALEDHNKNAITSYLKEKSCKNSS